MNGDASGPEKGDGRLTILHNKRIDRSTVNSLEEFVPLPQDK